MQNEARTEIHSPTLRSNELRSQIAALVLALSMEKLALALCCFLALVLVVFFVMLVQPLVFLRRPFDVGGE